MPTCPLVQLPGQRLDVIGLGLTSGQAASEPHGQRRHRAEQPREVGQQLRVAPRGRDLLDVMPERLRQLRRVARGPLTHRIDRRRGQRRVDRQPDLAGTGSAGRRLGERSVGRRCPGRVAGLVAGEHVEQLGGLGDRMGEHAIGDEEAVADVGADRHASPSGLEADQAAARGRDPDRAAAVVAMRDRHHPGRHGGRGAAAGAAGRALEVPWVAGGSEPPRLRGRQQARLGQRRLADDHEARLAHPSDQVRVVARDQVAEDVAAHRQRHPLDRAVVLDRDRHPGERSPVAGADLTSDRERGLRRDVGEGVERRVELFDPGQRGLDELARAQRSRAHQLRQLGHRTQQQV